MSDYAILARGLAYNYGDLMAVDHIDFEVDRGEVFGFLGPNGAGKTTTVKMLTGQMKPKAGKAEVLGFSVVDNVREVQGKIGICFEETNLYEGMSARENLKLFARLFEVKNFGPEKLLDRVRLSDRGDDKVQNYSKGMKQRLMVARSILHQPEILFLDEPTDGLDPGSAIYQGRNSGRARPRSIRLPHDAQHGGSGQALRSCCFSRLGKDSCSRYTA